MGTSVSFGDYSPGVLPVTIVVRTAYFARKKTEDIFEETTEEYTVVAGDNLSKIAGNYEGVSYQDIMEENGLNSTVISVGDTLTITSRTKTGERTSFERIKNGNVGDEVYIVAEHFGVVNSIQVTLKEKEALLTDGGTLPVLQDESEITTIELCEPEEENLKGTHRYAKVKLRPKEDETLEEWREKLGEKEVMGYTDGQRSIPPESYDRMITKEGWEPEYGDTKKSFLSIELEARGEGEITYGGTDKSNVFLNEEGEWFEVDGLSGLVYYIYADGRLEREIINEDKKVTYFYYATDGTMHGLGTLDFITIENVYGSLYGGETVNLIDVRNLQNYNEDNLKFGFTMDASRNYMNDKTLASLLGAMLECGFEDIVCNGFSHADGSSRPSKSHKNGYNGDFKYLRKDKKIKTGPGTSLDISANPKLLDADRQNKFINALHRFGWGGFLGWSYTIDDVVYYLDRIDKNTVGHHHHLHIQNYSPNLTDK